MKHSFTSSRTVRIAVVLTAATAITGSVIFLARNLGSGIPAASERVSATQINQEQATLGLLEAEIRRQRHTVEGHQKKAVALARQYGIPESALMSGTLEDLKRHVEGRDIVELIRAHNNLRINRSILEAAERTHAQSTQR